MCSQLDLLKNFTKLYKRDIKSEPIQYLMQNTYACQRKPGKRIYSCNTAFQVFTCWRFLVQGHNKQVANLQCYKHTSRSILPQCY